MNDETLQEQESNGPAEELASKLEGEKKEENPAGAESVCKECRPMLSRCMDTVRKWLGMGQAS